MLLGALNVWLEEHSVLVIAHLIVGTLLWSTRGPDRLPLAFSPSPVSAPLGRPGAAPMTAAAEA